MVQAHGGINCSLSFGKRIKVLFLCPARSAPAGAMQASNRPKGGAWRVVKERKEAGIGEALVERMAVVEFFQTGTAVRQNVQRYRRKNRSQPVLRRGPGGGPGEGGSKSGNKSRFTNAVTKGFAVSASPGRFLWYFLVRNTRKYTYCLCTAGAINFRSCCCVSSLQILMQS